MKVLMITGDKSFGPGHPRFDLQRSQVEELAVVFWGRGSLFPKIPPGPFDVVTAQDPFWRGLFAWRTARKLGARFNVQVHTDLASQPFLRRALAHIILRCADRIRTVSEKIQNQMAGMGIKTPISVLPIYIDIERFRNVSHKPGLPVQAGVQKTILWLGRFEDEKDPLYALKIFREMRESGVDARLIMLGSGSMEQELREQAVGLSVEFPGWKDPISYIAMADVVVSTSKHESYGASIIEALAAGVPVVAPDVGIAREAGAVIAPKDKLAEAVIEVLLSGQKGELKLHLPTAEAWAREWRESLL